MPDDTTTDDPLDSSDAIDVDDWAADLTYREAHLLTEGAFDGFRHIDPRFGKRVQGAVAGDSWYYKGGYIGGWALKAVLIGGGVAFSQSALPF